MTEATDRSPVAPPPAPPPPPDVPTPFAAPTRAALGQEVLLVFAATLVGCLAFIGLGALVPFVRTNIHAFVALLFLLLPAWALGRRGESLEDHGLHMRGAWRGLLFAACVSLLVLPPYVVGHDYWQREYGKRSLTFAWTHYSAFPESCQGAPLPAFAAKAAAAHGPAALIVSCERGALHVRWPGLLALDVVGARLRIEPLLGARMEQREGGVVRLVGLDGVVRIGVPPGGEATLTARRGDALLDARHIEAGTRATRAGENPVTYGRGYGWLLELLLAQVLAVALPEEMLYRGYFQGRLARLFPARRRWFGRDVPVLAIVLTSVLFALGHFLLDLDPQRLAVFFPSLAFGFLRTQSTSLAGCIAFHAACNVLVRLLGVHY